VNDEATGGQRRLLTPILAKASEEVPWPQDERLFYVLARDGLYMCRESEFFRSCVKAKGGPSELYPQEPFYEPRFPEIPAEVIERAVGFFTQIADLHGSEAAALLVWDRSERRVRLVVPDQVATMGGSTYRYPIGVHYDPAGDLPGDQVVFGDIHSHVDYAAYASHTDVEDELHSAGLHIVVGRIRDEPPQFHVEAVVDGQRFVLQLSQVAAGYRHRQMSAPQEWIDRVKIQQWSAYTPLRAMVRGDA
jgi:proteasome lid subunit RPN8/RPN11